VGWTHQAQAIRKYNIKPQRLLRLCGTPFFSLYDWLSDLICNPMREYTQFEAGLSLLPVLPPTDAAGLLEQRCERIEIELAQARAVREMRPPPNSPLPCWAQ